MTTATRDPATPYTFNNDKPTAGQLLGALGQMFDEFSSARLVRAGVTTGARCLEVGAGGGTIAAWMADQVGPTGEVIATDIKPQHIPQRPNMRVLAHNIITDELPGGEFDVIHARAVLQHLPQRREVLAKLVAALKPGGAVVIEEMETRWGSSVLATPDPRAYDIFVRYEAAMLSMLKSNGNDPTWARGVYTAMSDLSLDTDQEAWQRSWTGGDGVCLVAHSGSTEMRETLIKHGMSAEDLDVMAELTLDPRLAMRGILLLSTTGRKSE